MQVSTFQYFMSKFNLLLLTTILLFLNDISYSDGFLKRSGKKIVDGTGQEIILRGIGLGGWLVPEGYMLHTSGFANSPTEIRNKIASLIGESNTDNFFKIYRENYVNKKDIDKLAEWGFNSIRLPMHYNFFTPKNQPGVWLEGGFTIVDSLLNWCKTNKMYLILDLHCAPGGQNALNISDYQGYPSLWESEQNKTRTIDLWKKLAARYSHEEWIGGYDLINETAWDLGSNNVPLKNLFVDITNAIREVDQNHILFIEGNWFATDFSGLTPIWDENMAYSFHKYWNDVSVSTIQYLLNIRNTYNVPLWLGETGENSNGWFVELVEILEQQKIGWAWWPHKKIESTSCPLSAPKTVEYDYLLKYWNGQASKPTLDFAVNALNNMAAKLHIDSCDFHPDVIDALFRQVNNNETKPFSENKIPGIIYGVNYDLGKNSLAYKDNDYKNTTGDPGKGSWNSGGQYRNDGVDIEKCTDSYTNGYNVGWINTGEYLTYTIDVQESGTYLLNIRVAANADGGKILFKLDGQNLGNVVDIPGSGGWQKWRTVNMDNFYFSSGQHKLQIMFFNGGFNFNFVQFNLTTTDVKDNYPINTFEIFQNYPNPFNPLTKIKYQIPEDGLVTLKLYDLLGNEIVNLINEWKPKGKYEAELNAAHYNLTSGVYFYQMIFNGNKTNMMKAVLIK